MTSNHYKNALKDLEILCDAIPERCVGSDGNRQATDYFNTRISSLGWNTVAHRFDAIDWKEEGANLKCGDNEFRVLVSPYSNGYQGSAILVAASSVAELTSLDIKGKIILLHGEIAQEQLMPKNFIFYNPEEHQRIIRLLEKGKPEAIIAATGRNAALAGGVYPFPLIEDGDFDIPSVYMTDIEGAKLLHCAGRPVFLESRSERIPATGYNVVAAKFPKTAKKIVITAHIDAKKGSPGAIDNATGVVVLLLLAEKLRDYGGDKQIEIVAFNGEDYYAVPGQMNYLMNNTGHFSDILININIDGAGYKEGFTAFSVYGLPDEQLDITLDIIGQYPGITLGASWMQGDHGIFIQQGVPAVAVSSEWFIDNISTQSITHTPKDNPSIVDCQKLIEISEALNDLVRLL